METTRVFVYVVVLLFCVDNVQCQTRDDVDSLYRDLFNTSYNPLSRPEYNQSKPTVIDFEFHLLSFVTIDETKGVFSVTGFLSLKWTDPRLAWNPRDYGMTTSIILPRNKVWKPEFIIVNPASSLTLFGPDEFPIRYTYDGKSIWNVGDLMEAVCEYDVTKFPFDKHSCEIQLFPVGTLAHEIEFTSTRTTVGLTSFKEGGEWSLIKSEVSFQERLGLFKLAFIDFTVRRRSEFFLVNMFAPILIILHLNTFVFLLPADAGGRTEFSMTCILSTAVFMTAVSDQLPASSLPLSSLTYFLMNMLILSTAVGILNIICLRCYFTNKTEQVPKYLSRLVASWQSIIKNLKKWECSRSKASDSDRDSPENKAVNEEQIEAIRTDETCVSSEEKTLEEVPIEPPWRKVGHFLDIIFFVVTITLAILISMIFFISTAP
ncbi:neuronal acetylcholine receptor subunit alpha-3-like [Mizuhopecten yessoensis]|uniref:neuronal acetylcholine receptor subunit alpha-3-like n=1 Tax=Mizuhopecten yessoensis TaxID=6573 RepID=UPI000B45B818|nr:neuronal acetylcholine receptor subunit alpha-3-like [Mizuhopecten yessoensis]